jgi:hypothetical protein
MQKIKRTSTHSAISLPGGVSPLSRRHSANGRTKPVRMTEEDMTEMLRAFPRQTEPNRPPKRLIHGYWG